MEDEVIQGKTWQTFYEYLLFLFENIRKIRKRYVFKYDEKEKISEGLKANRLVNGKKSRFHNRKYKKELEKLTQM